MAKIGEKQRQVLGYLDCGYMIKDTFVGLQVVSGGQGLDRWVTQHLKGVTTVSLLSGELVKKDNQGFLSLTEKGKEFIKPTQQVKSTEEQLKEAVEELYRKLYHSDDCEGECEHDKLLLKVKELAGKL